LSAVFTRQHGESASIDFREVFDRAEAGESRHFGHAETGLLQVLMCPLDAHQPVFGMHGSAQRFFAPSLQLA
jgi:hypothetical protein